VALTSYKKLLAMGKEALEKAKAIPRAAEMKMKALHEMSKIDVEIADQEAKIADASSEYPINFDKLIRAIDDKTLLERRKRMYGEIIVEMFPDSPKVAAAAKSDGKDDEKED
jgi:hypothetical protein